VSKNNYRRKSGKKKFRRGRGKTPRSRKPRTLAIESFIHEDVAGRIWNEYIPVKVHPDEPFRFYDISNWRSRVDDLVNSYSGRGVSDKALRRKAHHAVQEIVENHIEYRRPGRIAWRIVKQKIEERLTDELKRCRDEVESEKRRRMELNAANWAGHPKKKFPSQDRIKEMADKYLKRRGDLVNKKRKSKTLTGSFSHLKQNVLPIRIGLDFGTSSIKAAYRTEDQQIDKTYPLPLGRGRGINKYIINPSMQFKGKKFRFRIERAIEDISWKRCLSCHSGGSLVCTEGRKNCPLKKQIKNIPELNKMDIQEAVQFLTSVYLGYALKHIDRVLIKDLKKRFQTDQYRCIVHMCVPIGDLEKVSCTLVFQDALTLADQMFGLNAFEDDSGEIPTLLQQWNECRRLPVMLEDNSDRRSQVFPEVYAEVASYAISKVAQPGTYILIDIGAGTVDLNVFRWVRASRTSVWAAYCEGTGVLALEEKIIDLLSDYKDKAVECFHQQMERGDFPDMDGFSSLSSNRGKQSDLKNALADIYEGFCSSLANKSRQTWIDARNKRGKGKWNKLGVFIGGGGSAIRGLGEKLLDGIDNQVLNQIQVEPLPLPDKNDFEKPALMPKKEFHRVAVAYGLTVAHQFEGKLTLPSEIQRNTSDDDDGPDYTDRYPRHEDT